MPKFKIGYIDESPEDVRAFQRYASSSFEVIPIKPIAKIEELVQEIISNHLDCLIVDYDLSEHDNTIHYSGVDVVEVLLKEREYFPIFILTSYSSDAEEKGEDVNRVYEKTLMFEKDQKFLNRIKVQIEKYQHKLAEKEERLLELLDKESLTETEENEIVELNYEIEKSLSKNEAKRLHQFDVSNQKRLTVLLKKVEDLMKEIKGDGGD